MFAIKSFPQGHLLLTPVKWLRKLNPITEMKDAYFPSSTSWTKAWSMWKYLSYHFMLQCTNCQALHINVYLFSVSIGCNKSLQLSNYHMHLNIHAAWHKQVIKITLAVFSSHCSISDHVEKTLAGAVPNYITKLHIPV